MVMQHRSAHTGVEQKTNGVCRSSRTAPSRTWKTGRGEGLMERLYGTMADWCATPPCAAVVCLENVDASVFVYTV
jgi:hypothetical protein